MEFRRAKTLTGPRSDAGSIPATSSTEHIWILGPEFDHLTLHQHSQFFLVAVLHHIVQCRIRAPAASA